ncbi:alpha/beta hydrolase [Sulfurimonas marina]|uniref:Alpha/beta hydrolase n=1 Tax=Sulfurimonas marina TaxID=2590551 RepID=A0A7M1AUS5_9BACT|nr:alpha/beta hydrolase [Sulfurimonas marina]QOP41169.1 alpha/beta hydrolase [Sulfurimonas marina]
MIYIAFILFTLFILFFVLYQWQYFLIFSPTYIKERRLCEQCEPLEIVTDDGISLEGVVYEPKEFKETLLFFAGRSHDSVALIQKLQATYPKSRIITFNYRSYGRNKGSVTEKNMLEDALHIAKIVQKNYGDFYLLGFSIGSSLCAYIASKMKVKGVFLVGAFDSIPLIAKIKFNCSIPEMFIKYKFPTIEFVQNIESDTYIFLSQDDDITYIENGRNLSKSVKNLTFYKEYENLSHKELLWDEEVVGYINGVVNR